MRLRKYLVRGLAAVGALTLIVITAVLIATFTGGPTVPEPVVLTLDLRKGIAEYVPQNPVARLVHRDEASFYDVLSAIERAGQDPRVVGLLARVDEAPLGLAQLQELRDGIAAFTASGKPSLAFAETVGGLLPGNGAYYLASSFGEVVVQPSGDVGLVGLSAEVPFVRGALEKLGIEAHFSKRDAYKTAPNLFTEDGFTEAHREELTARMEGRFTQIVEGISESRGILADTVRALATRGPLTAEQAREAKLIDRVAYLDEALTGMPFGAQTERLSLSAYAERTSPGPSPGEDGVALVYGVGTLLSGPSRYEPVSGDATAGSDTVVEAIRKAADDHTVRAIVLRLDSGGGSFVASDAIWRATRRAKESGKRVIVSMGNVAASGAYLVSTHADRILAQPGTVTGSIGVYAGKFVTRELWEKLGVSWEAIATGERARIASSLQDFTPDQQAVFERQLDRVYSSFVGRVKDGRGLTEAQAELAAKGRVWLGDGALEMGLVDELGGLSKAITVARSDAGLGPMAPVRVFPKERSLLELVMDEGLEGASVSLSTDVVRRAQSALRPVLWLLRLATHSGAQETVVPFSETSVR